MVEYNEAIFLRPVKIKIIAIFGDKNKQQINYLCHKYNVECFKSAKDFYEQKIAKQKT
ncbi:MAG: hypothetical protein GXP45_06180 [bacterium]|nr:hypothetical protein [bacterium]